MKGNSGISSFFRAISCDETIIRQIGLVDGPN